MPPVTGRGSAGDGEGRRVRWSPTTHIVGRRSRWCTFGAPRRGAIEEGRRRRGGDGGEERRGREREGLGFRGAQKLTLTDARRQ